MELILFTPHCKDERFVRLFFRIMCIDFRSTLRTEHYFTIGKLVLRGIYLVFPIRSKSNRGNTIRDIVFDD